MFKNEIPLDLKLSIWLTKTVQKRYKKHLLCTYSLAASLYWSMQSTGLITRICAGCIMDGITGSNPGLSWHIQPNFIFSDKCAHLILIAWPTIVIFRSHVMHFFNNKIVLKYLPFFHKHFLKKSRVVSKSKVSNIFVSFKYLIFKRQKKNYIFGNHI